MKLKLFLLIIAAVAVSANCHAMVRRAPVRRSRPATKCNVRSFSNQRSVSNPVFGPDYDLGNLIGEFKRSQRYHIDAAKEVKQNQSGAFEFTPKEKERYASYCPRLKNWVDSEVMMNAKYYAGFEQTVQKHLNLQHNLSYVQQLQKTAQQEQKEELMKLYKAVNADISQILKEHMIRLKVRDDIQ